MFYKPHYRPNTNFKETPEPWTSKHYINQLNEIIISNVELNSCTPLGGLTRKQITLIQMEEQKRNQNSSKVPELIYMRKEMATKCMNHQTTTMLNTDFQ